MMYKILVLILTACLCLSPAGCFRNSDSSQLVTVPMETAEESASKTEPAETEPSESVQIPIPEPEEDAFVPVGKYLSGIYVDLKYASADNFTGQQIYAFRDVYLRYGTVKKLIQVQSELESLGLSLKIWDGFRPVLAQYRLWSVCPDPTYVANPETGFSSHSRGNTVDLTLVDSEGRELEMPTGFDDFSSLADRDYSDCSQTAANNAMLLQTIMEKYGFSGYSGEWWHYSDTVKYDVEEVFLPVYLAEAYTNGSEAIPLFVQPDIGADVTTQIPAYADYQMLAWHGEFVMVDYQGIWGYLRTADLPAVE